MARAGQRFVELCKLLAAAARIVRAAAALATDNRCDGLDYFARLELLGEFGRNGCQERDGAVGGAAEHDDTLKVAFQSVGYCLKKVPVPRPQILDDGLDGAERLNLGADILEQMPPLEELSAGLEALLG